MFSCTVEARRLGVHRDRQGAAARAGVRRRRQPRGWGWTPGGRASENRKFIQAPSSEICSETISGGEGCWRGRGVACFLGYPPRNKINPHRTDLSPPLPLPARLMPKRRWIGCATPLSVSGVGPRGHDVRERKVLVGRKASARQGAAASAKTTDAIG